MPRKNLLSLHEAIVIALINQPSRTASFEEIAKFIEERNLYPERKGNIPLATQVMLRSTKAKGAYLHLFEEIGAGFIRLQDSYAGFPLQLYSALQEILEPFKHFFEPASKKISVVDLEWGENRKVVINPKDVICVFSNGNGRKKTIYTFQNAASGVKEIKKYSKQQKLEDFLHEIDPLSYWLAMISKDSLINVEYFSNSFNRVLKTNIDDRITKEWPVFKFSDSKKAKEYFQNFSRIQLHNANLTSLQKKAFDYKNHFGF